MTKMAGSRVRDPERRERILDAAAELISRHGFLSVSLSDIGSAAGIVGSGIYRHFDSKGAILVEMFDRVVDQLIANAEESFALSPDPQSTLGILVNGQVELVLRRRALCQVYVRESRNLPDSDQLRLRWKQRHYVALCEDTLCTVRPSVSHELSKVIVGAAISSIHSVLSFSSGLGEAELADTLRDSACRVLQVAPQDFSCCTDERPAQVGSIDSAVASSTTGSS